MNLDISADLNCEDETGFVWTFLDDATFTFTPDGMLAYPNFVETVTKLIPFYWGRALGGSLFLAGLVLMLFNLLKTAGTGSFADEEVTLPDNQEETHKIAHWHQIVERKPLLLAFLTLVVILIGGLVEMVPTFLIRSNIPTIASVKPYTPLELEGRDIYVREGCYTCHSQMIRPFRDEVERYGDYSKPGEFVYDHPFQWGSKRTGPDLQRVGGKYPSLWHVRHMAQPDSTTPGSIMPRYPHLLTDAFDTSEIGAKMRALRTVGVPYTDGQIDTAVSAMQAQARAIATEVESQQGPAGLADKEIIALIAYLQKLGADFRAGGIK